MAVKQNLALVRRIVDEIWNQGELDVADVVFAPDYVNHNGLIPDLVRGPEAIKFSVALYRIAFPNLRISADVVRAEDDTVTLRWTAWSRSPAAADVGSPSESMRSLEGTMVIRMERGQIAESWTEWDQGDALQRLGLTAPVRSASVEQSTCQLAS